MGPKFPKNYPKTLCFHNENEPHGILNRIFSFEPDQADQAETQHLVQKRWDGENGAKPTLGSPRRGSG